MKKYLLKCRLFLLPSLLGVALFYVFPYLRVIYYSLIENQFSRKFVGLKNYLMVLKNTYFRLALKNSLLLIVIAVPVLVAAAFGLSVLLLKMNGRWKILRIAFIFPMLVPTASVVVVWRTLFDAGESVLPVYLLFIYKNIGLLVILFSAAFSTLDHTVFEAARLDGAHGFNLHRKITLPLIYPTLLFVVLIGVVYSFKVFRESYLYFGTNYPPDHSYTLQYYMNNHFFKLNYQYLAAAAVLTSLIIYLIVYVGVKLQKKFAS
ncbi:MAG: sugar ABC transporter permease [Lachnospiraceae bacterium]|nr:sugar ABC transporter permease [Lachnospiraceae bacterium]